MQLIKINTSLALLNILEFYDNIIPLSCLSNTSLKNISIIEWPSYVIEKDRNLYYASARYKKSIKKVEIKITTDE